MMHIFASLAEFERDLIKERTEKGRREAKKKGVRFGRPKQPKPERASMCAQLYRAVTVCRPSCGLPVFDPGTHYTNTSVWRE